MRKEGLIQKQKAVEHYWYYMLYTIVKRQLLINGNS